MATNYNILMKRYNGTDWDILRPLTLSDNIDTTSQVNQFVTAAQSTAITTYLTSGFNGANQLLKLDANGLIPSADLPFSISDYLTKSNPTFTGNLTATAGGANPILLNDNKLNFGTGTASGSNALYEFKASGLGLDIKHDIGAGFVNSINVTPSQVAFNSKKLTGLSAPTANTDAATKEYVDNLVSVGFSPKDPVAAASTANIDIAVALNTLDGYTLAALDRVLLKNQTTATQNGVYQLNASKVPQKVAGDSGIGSAVFIENGNTNNDYIYVSTAANSWTAFSKVDTIGVIGAGGLEKTGNNLGIKTAGVTNAMLAGSITYTKLNDTAISDTLSSWTDPSYGTSGVANSLTVWLQSALSAIKMARGTASYKTDNSQTISGAYTAIGGKNSTTLSNANPVNTNRVAGDIHYQYA